MNEKSITKNQPSTAKDQPSVVENSDTATDNSQVQVSEKPNKPNVVFVGDKVGRVPEKSFENGMSKKIQMPDAEVQKNPFYHERASEIISISPWYKEYREKG